MFYVSWVAKRTLSLTAPLPSVLGVTWATLSLGVLPFLLVLHRAEQAALVPLLIGCTLPVVSTPNGDARWRSWGFAALYVLLSWFMLAGHTKTVLLLPALLLSAALMIRRWLPVMMLFGAAAFGFIETYRLWQVRYDCPNSPFLAQIYRSVAVSPDDLASGITPFLQRIEVNLLGASKYWRAAEFGLDFQSYWLPSASQVTSVEHVINFMLPALVLLAVLIIVLAIIIELTNKSERFCLSRGTAIAAALLVGLLSLAALQINKNFYEASLQFPVLSLAVLLALPAVLRRTACARTLWSGAIVGLVMLALSSNAALALRLWAELPHWWGKIASRELRQQALGRVIERCGIDKGPNSKRLILDDFAYSVLWRTREPMFMAFFEGWWATGLDQKKLIAERKVSGLIAHCNQFPAKYSGLAVTDQTFCCVNFK